MKLYLAEAIKMVKLLNDDLVNILSDEDSHSSITYRDESERITTNYNYDETRQKVSDLSEKILNLKKAINNANNVTKIGVKDYTIADGLIKMSLIRKELVYHLEQMARREKLTRKVDMRNDGLIYNELLYEPDECREYVKVQKELLNQIQMGIDRANLTTFVEI